ncbi:SIR2 family NAD-dependent protein deacylase [Paraburkholderia sp. MM5477-R1]|uniref:SIR2 family NAD-dependent protein deacylase n=1 Tax=Paraburkholderia sp. MM5477-R1 TaxID=2991062 RepID=UPI003D246E72
MSHEQGDKTARVDESFPDRFAIDTIRAALWRGPANTRACVMIGAGFSRNADPVSSSARDFPTWGNMAAALTNALYPPEETRWRHQALKDASATSGFLRLAQEYETAFGRLALNECIRSLVPDHDYQPGAMHRRLLTLPWGDIFTTNWDTLLERAGRDVFSRNYDTVHTYAEIPGAQRPRIVHLHGSFPAYDPFVFTEEDFRRYPVTHAPFVNLVQQALMESTLCLLGFSGDDPNFLHWSGWVRDNLGPHSPKIFLVGWLNLSPHRRRMLESRNVVPVDLSMLPGVAHWPPEVRHKYSLRWLLTELECPPVQNPLQWPRVGKEVTCGEPARELFTHPAEASSAASAQGKSDGEDKLGALLKLWEEERSEYPDWFIAPKRVRDAVWKRTVPCLDDLEKVAQKPPDRRLVKLFREASWRLNVALAPPTPFTESCHQLLQDIHFFDEGDTPSHTGFWVQTMEDESLEAVQHIAMFVLRAAVREGDKERFDKTRHSLARSRFRPLDLNNELTYANALWLRDHARFADLGALLFEWNVDLADHGWAIRKAGMLSYLGAENSSRALGSATIRNIRQNRRRDIVDLAAFSREAWALWHLPRSDGSATVSEKKSRAGTEILRVRQAEEEGDEAFDEWANDASVRWRELAVYDCNPIADCSELFANLYAGRVTHDSDVAFVDSHTGPDSMTRRNLKPSRRVYEISRRVYEMLRLADEVSLGCVNGQSRQFEVALRASIVESAADAPYMASIYGIRLANGANDPLLKQVFSPNHVKDLESPLYDILVKILETELEFLESAETSRFWRKNTRTKRGEVVPAVLAMLKRE